MGRGRAGAREKWRHCVLASDVADAVKVTLIAYSLFMTDAGYVSVPRKTIAELVAKHPRKISEHVATAVKIGLLAKIGGGFRGRTTQYVAVLTNRKGAASGVPFEVGKGAVSGQPFCTSDGTLSPRANRAMVAVSGVPITRVTKANPAAFPCMNATTASHVTDRSPKDGSDERTPARSPLAADPPMSSWNMRLAWAPLGRVPTIIRYYERSAA